MTIVRPRDMEILKGKSIAQIEKREREIKEHCQMREKSAWKERDRERETEDLLAVLLCPRPILLCKVAAGVPPPTPPPVLSSFSSFPSFFSSPDR